MRKTGANPEKIQREIQWIYKGKYGRDRGGYRGDRGKYRGDKGGGGCAKDLYRGGAVFHFCEVTFLFVLLRLFCGQQWFFSTWHLKYPFLVLFTTEFFQHRSTIFYIVLFCRAFKITVD
jgi:hypothetical protein